MSIHYPPNWRTTDHGIKAVYVADDFVDRTFLERTRHLLKSLAGLARELEDTIRSKLQSAVQIDLTSVTLITLSYHEVSCLTPH